MGGVPSIILRQFRRINVENRAFRAIERKTTVPAPRHSTTEKMFQEIIEGTPDVKANLLIKNINLDKHLKDVFVTSTGFTPEIKRDKSSLPQDKTPVEDTEMGFWEAPEVKEGHCSLRQALVFLANHQRDPVQWSVAKIAKEYKLDENKVCHVLEYYKAFNLYIPSVQKDKGGIYSIQRISESIAELLPPSSSKETEKSKKEGEVR